MNDTRNLVVKGRRQIVSTATSTETKHTRGREIKVKGKQHKELESRRMSQKLIKGNLELNALPTTRLAGGIVYRIAGSKARVIYNKAHLDLMSVSTLSFCINSRGRVRETECLFF
jgi:hypothetical protein